MSDEITIQHGIRCTHCGDEVFSNHRHDFKSCKCKKVSIDGGFDYIKISFKEADDYEQITRSMGEFNKEIGRFNGDEK